MADFDPRQLDQLEDALELLEHERDDLESLELSPEVLARLDEYEDVLALCRDAFPLESPPDELLDSVISEAREVSRRPRSRDVNERSGWRRAWERWRGTVVPGLALATTAAVVLWVLDPQAPAEPDLPSDRLEDRKSVELERTQPAAESSNAGREVEKSDEPIPEPSAEPPEQEDNVEPEQIQPKSKAPAKSKISSPVPVPEPAPTPMSKDETWTELERGDAARRTGNCERARSIYEDVIAASSDAQAIARAKGGIGLCLEQNHRDSEATQWFDDARTASPGIDSWIDSQRDEQPLPGKAKKTSNKKADAYEADAEAL